jgi:hypothetical protein
LKTRDVLVDHSRMYALVQDHEGRLYLEVTCGGFAMEDVSVPLTDEEKMQLEAEGKPFLDELAWRICKNPEEFRNRRR